MSGNNKAREMDKTRVLTVSGGNGDNPVLGVECTPSPSPSSQIGDYLLTLPQLLEPFTSQDSPALSAALRDGRLPYPDTEGGCGFGHGQLAVAFLFLTSSKGRLRTELYEQNCTSSLHTHTHSPRASRRGGGRGSPVRLLARGHSQRHNGHVHPQHSPHSITPSASSFTAGH